MLFTLMLIFVFIRIRKSNSKNVCITFMNISIMRKKNVDSVSEQLPVLYKPFMSISHSVLSSDRYD